MGNGGNPRYGIFLGWARPVAEAIHGQKKGSANAPIPENTEFRARSGCMESSRKPDGSPSEKTTEFPVKSAPFSQETITPPGYLSSGQGFGNHFRVSKGNGNPHPVHTGAYRALPPAESFFIHPPTAFTLVSIPRAGFDCVQPAHGKSRCCPVTAR